MFFKLGPNNTPENSRKRPKNPHHKGFLRNDKRICNATFELLTGRRMNLSVQEICKVIKVSPPTFYLHYTSPGTLREVYEQKMTQEFGSLFSRPVSREKFFSVLTVFIVKHRQYFVMAEKNGDMYWLCEILTIYRSRLVDRSITNRSYSAYSGAVIMIIYCWIHYEHPNNKTSLDCAKALKSLRVMHIT